MDLLGLPGQGDRPDGGRRPSEGPACTDRRPAFGAGNARHHPVSRPLDPRLLRAAPSLRRALPWVAALQLVSALLGVAQAFTLAQVLSSVVLRNTSGSALSRPLLVLAAVAGGRAALAAVQEWLAQRTSASVRYELRRQTVAA